MKTLIYGLSSTFLWFSMLIFSAQAQGSRFAVRFYGTGTGQIDRIKIPLESSPALNVGSNFTFEFWIRAAYSNNAGVVYPGLNGDGWITGNVLLDRDIYGTGDYGDFGVALGRDGTNLVLAFGAHNGSWGQTIVGTRNVGDDAWHHVAITRVASNGTMAIYVDGTLDASGTGPTGNLSYRIGRATDWPNSDPFLVIGAEKHDAGSEYPSYNGYFDELRIWSRALTTYELAQIASALTPPAEQNGLVAYFRLEEGSGTALRDSASGHTGTLFSAQSGNGEWSSWTNGSYAAPVEPFAPTLELTAITPTNVALAWFVPQNYRFEVQFTDNLLSSSPWIADGAWTNVTATDSNFIATVSASDVTTRFFRVFGQPYR